MILGNGPTDKGKTVIFYGGPNAGNHLVVPFNVFSINISYIDKDEEIAPFWSTTYDTKYSAYKNGCYKAYYYSGSPLIDDSCHVYVWQDMSHEEVVAMWYDRNGWENNPFIITSADGWYNIDMYEKLKPKFEPGKNCLF